MAVALVALVVSMGGTGLAATKLVKGDKLIKKHSLSGNRLHNHTVRGKQIKLSSLGKVPSAATADTATNAGHATTADTATNAGHAGTADTATNAGHATSADSADTATDSLNLPATLPSGKSLTGTYGVLGANSDNGYAGITFVIPLSARPTINYIPDGAAVPPACAGGTVDQPKAQPGNLCIFEAFHNGSTPGAFDPATNSTTTGNVRGVIVYNTSSSGGASAAEGTWAVTAP